VAHTPTSTPRTGNPYHFARVRATSRARYIKVLAATLSASAAWFARFPYQTVISRGSEWLAEGATDVS